MSELGEWSAKAACAGYDGRRNEDGEVEKKDTHFPISKRRTKLETYEPDRHVLSADEAKRICRSCEVQEECLDYALSLKEAPDGVWGGLSKRERNRHKKKGVA